EHPGGAQVLRRHEGQDATEAFLAAGHSQGALSLLPGLAKAGAGLYDCLVEVPGTSELAQKLLQAAGAGLLTLLPRIWAGQAARELPHRGVWSFRSSLLGVAVVGLAAQALPVPCAQVPVKQQVRQGACLLALALSPLLPPTVLSLSCALALAWMSPQGPALRGVLAWTLLLQ
ncbi:unnamed protein product, partial [Effrenium voratum]